MLLSLCLYSGVGRRGRGDSEMLTGFVGSIVLGRPAAVGSSSVRSSSVAGRCRAAPPDIGVFVDESLRSKFDAVEIDRVLASWDAARTGKTLEQFTSNGEVLQRAESFVDGLEARPWHETEEYEWAMKLEDSADIIRNELMKSLAMKSLEKRGNNVWATVRLPLCLPLTNGGKAKRKKKVQERK